MGVSNFTLSKIFNIIKDQLLETKIEKIINISNNDYILSIYKNGKSNNLFLSLDPSLPLILLSSSMPIERISNVSYSCNILKKYFEHGVILDAEKVENDRILVFSIKKWTTSYQLLETKLIFELFPLSPNIVITDKDYVIIDALKFSNSIESKHLIYKGLKYQFPILSNKQFDEHTPLEALQGKINKAELKYLSSLTQEEYITAIKEAINNNKLYLHNYDLSSFKIHPEAIEVSMADLYKELLKARLALSKHLKYQNLFKIVESKIKANERKLQNLEKDKEKFINYNHYQEYGNLLFLDQGEYKKGDTSINILGIDIPLDSRLNLKENAQRYFKLYKKSKSGLIQNDIQKEIAKQELDYFKQIEIQLKYATYDDIQEIIQDLSEHHYIKNNSQNTKHNKKPSNKKPKPHYIKSPKGIKIGYGLSSFQNEELSFNIAQKNNIFLHIKDYHGPHVIIFDDNPDDETLLFAGEIALYFADKTAGEVNYCPRYCIKKVPGKRGLVTMNQYSTMVINQIRSETLNYIQNNS